MMKQSKSSSSSSSSSSSLIVDMDFEYADSQSNIAPLNAVLDSRGMEIVPVVEEINRPFSDYLEEEIFNDNPDALPNYLILSAIIKETKMKFCLLKKFSLSLLLP
jgi:hypothetical protein